MAIFTSKSIQILQANADQIDDQLVEMQKVAEKKITDYINLCLETEFKFSGLSLDHRYMNEAGEYGGHFYISMHKGYGDEVNFSIQLSSSSNSGESDYDLQCMEEIGRLAGKLREHKENILNYSNAIYTQYNTDRQPLRTDLREVNRSIKTMTDYLKDEAAEKFVQSVNEGHSFNKPINIDFRDIKKGEYYHEVKAIIVSNNSRGYLTIAFYSDTDITKTLRLTREDLKKNYLSFIHPSL